jgi:8-oxo-dGTP pyrophosphatase MutT (NUDIX family)
MSLYKKKKRNYICTNCGEYTHEYKQCSEPITSWGVILVKYGNMKHPTHTEVDINILDDVKRIHIETSEDRLIASNVNANIMFLLISRKYSVGYVEFIRGVYRPEKIDQVVYLFKQMKQNELDMIKYSLSIENGFLYLWNTFWGTKHDLIYLSKDKKRSEENYNILLYNGVDGPELDLKTIVDMITIDYHTDEWGFPKGRRNKYESEIDCAVREFKEETGYTDDDFVIINKIKPLVEIFIGTNGVTYRHIYYIAELISDKMPKNNITESQKDEIGNIQFMNFQTALLNIREYHIPRKKLLEKLYIYYMDRLLLSNKNNILYINKKYVTPNTKNANI